MDEKGIPAFAGIQNTTIAVLYTLWVWNNFASTNNHVFAVGGTLNPNSMKTFKKSILVIMAIVAVSLTSCKKDDDGGGGGGAGSGTVVAKVGGSNFKSLEMASTASETNAGGSTTITIQGSDANGKGIFIIINNFDGTGTYEFSDSNVFVNATYVEANINNPMNSQTWSAPYQNSGVVGEVKVSEKTDTKIKGTFNFKAKNSNDQSIKNITEGSFNLDFQ